MLVKICPFVDSAAVCQMVAEALFWVIIAFGLLELLQFLLIFQTLSFYSWSIVGPHFIELKILLDEKIHIIWPTPKLYHFACHSSLNTPCLNHTEFHAIFISSKFSFQYLY